MNLQMYFSQNTDLGDAVPEEVKEVADAVQHTNMDKIMTWVQEQIPVLIHFGIKLIIFLIILFAGRKLIKWVLKIAKKTLEKSSIEESAEDFLVSVLRALLYIFLIMILAGYVGVAESSIIALLGSAGLAIGLALQGSLANFAGGVLILLLKPFKIGDYIISAGGEGTVESIDIFYTKLLTVDNKVIVIPNGSITNESITNVTCQSTRRIDLEICIDYSQNIGEVKDLLFHLAESHELVLKEEEITIFVSSFDASAIVIGFRFWTATENYWTLKWDMHEKIKKAFDDRNIVIPFDQLDVNLTLPPEENQVKAQSQLLNKNK